MKKLLLFTSLLFAAACGKKETPAPPTPVATFETSRTVVEVGEEFTVLNTSTNTLQSVWLLDDGQKFTQTSSTPPQFTFTRSGNHVIRLQVFSPSGVIDSTRRTITVGYRYLKYIDVLAVPFTDSQGRPWSTAGGPNVRVDFSQARYSDEYTTPTTPNVAPATLPLHYTTANLPFNQPIPIALLQLTGTSTYRLGVYHIPPSPAASRVLMATWLFDAAAPSSNRNSTGDGFYELTDQGNTYKVRVGYETHP